MKRRNFIKTPIATASLGTLETVFGASTAEQSNDPGREFYELRLYHLAKEKEKLFDDFYRNAAIPAMNRAGIKPVGVFTEMTPSDNPVIYVLIPHTSIGAFASANDRIGSDPEYQKLGMEFLNAPAFDPAYVRIESSLMGAIASVPKLEVPAAVSEKKPRVFELRTYESHSKAANKKKIEIFNTGELAIFRRAGLQPVFFGETMIGTRLPNLTYMLTFADMAAHDKTWRGFSTDPEWKKLSATPGYTDAEIVCKISKVFLQPTAYSQI